MSGAQQADPIPGVTQSIHRYLQSVRDVAEADEHARVIFEKLYAEATEEGLEPTERMHRYERLLALKPPAKLRALVLLRCGWVRIDHYRERQAYGAKAIEADPRCIQAHSDQCLAFVVLREFEKAILHADIALELLGGEDPSLDVSLIPAYVEVVRLFRAVALAKLDRMPEAFEELERIPHPTNVTKESLIRIIDSPWPDIGPELEQNSDLVSPETMRDGGVPPVEEGPESPSPGAAEQPQPPMADVIDAIDRLAAFVPEGTTRDTYKAKLIADFEDATGITVRDQGETRLKWEQDALPDENPAAFAWRAYQAEAEAGTLHRGLIAQEDKPLSIKLANWLRTHKLPEGIDIPSKPEWTSRRIAEFGGSPRPTRIWTEEGRLSQAARYRTTKATLAKN